MTIDDDIKKYEKERDEAYDNAEPEYCFYCKKELDMRNSKYSTEDGLGLTCLECCKKYGNPTDRYKYCGEKKLTKEEIEDIKKRYPDLRYCKNCGEIEEIGFLYVHNPEKVKIRDIRGYSVCCEMFFECRICNNKEYMHDTIHITADKGVYRE